MKTQTGMSMKAIYRVATGALGVHSAYLIVHLNRDGRHRATAIGI